MSRTYLFCHPDNLDQVKASFPEMTGLPLLDTFGVVIRASPHVPRTDRRWVPPRGRFWECEESDRNWCEPLGLGSYVETIPYFLIRPRDGSPTPPEMFP